MKDQLAIFGDLFVQVNLKNYNTYGIATQAEYLIKPRSSQDLVDLLAFLKENQIKYLVLGRGSNVILPDKPFQGVIINLDNLKKVEFQDNTVAVEAGCSNALLVNKCLEKDFVNLAFLAGIPGTIGASIRGNAGCYKHEIMEYVKDVTFIDETGEIKTLEKKDISYGYRFTSFKKRKAVIIKATFNLIKGNKEAAQEEIRNNLSQRKSMQPLEFPNAGSVFKNPLNNAAGKLIEEAGLKGTKVGGAMVSEKHANFIINYNNATSFDIIKLIKIIKKEIKKKYNIDLELEQEIIKW